MRAFCRLLLFGRCHLWHHESLPFLLCGRRSVLRLRYGCGVRRRRASRRNRCRTTWSHMIFLLLTHARDEYLATYTIFGRQRRSTVHAICQQNAIAVRASCWMHKHLDKIRALVFLTVRRLCQVFDALFGGVTPPSPPVLGEIYMTDFRACSSEIVPECRLEREACIQLNLTPRAYGGEYSAHVFGELTCRILENGVSVPSQGERTLGVAGNPQIRMIEQIVGFCSK